MSDPEQIELFAAEVNWLTIPGVDINEKKEDAEEKPQGESLYRHVQICYFNPALGQPIVRYPVHT